MKMAELLGVSTKTVKNRMMEYNLSSEPYSTMPDEELDRHVRQLLQHNRRCGANSMTVRLRNVGFRIQRERVRKAMQCVDPAGVALSSQRVIKRRTYIVQGPNSLWHMDGNHKLIRWRFVIHGAVDGFSRLITYKRASTNNRASTVLAYFREAVQQYGMPSRIRCDNGGENVLVCSLMEETYGTGRGSAIRGRSVHNQRIERMWLDVWNGVVNTFYDLFTVFESQRLLDPNSEEQIYALHYVYLPRINQALDLFVQQWNHHILRTENMSPLQLSVNRSLELYSSMSTATRGIFRSSQSDEAVESSSEAGSSITNDLEDAIGSDFNNLTLVNVPDTVEILTEDEMSALRQQVNPLLDISSEDMGLSHYLEVLDFISQKMLDRETENNN